jgi:hypothetical protein
MHATALELQTERSAAAKRSQLDAMFADDGEGRQEMRSSEKHSNLFANVHKLQAAACGSSRDVEANQRADAHAIHAGEVGQVEHDAFGIGEQLFDLVIENIVRIRHQPAMASHNDGVASTFYV